MTSSLESSVRAKLRPAAINAAVAMLRESAPGVVKAYDASVAAVLDGLSANLIDPARRAAAVNFISISGVVCSVSDVASLVKPGVSPPAVAAGNRLLELVFGDRIGPVANQIGTIAGVKSSSAYILLSLAATLTIGTLSQSLEHERVTATRLVRLVEDRKVEGPGRRRTSAVAGLSRAISFAALALVAAGALSYVFFDILADGVHTLVHYSTAGASAPVVAVVPDPGQVTKVAASQTVTTQVEVRAPAAMPVPGAGRSVATAAALAAAAVSAEAAPAVEPRREAIVSTYKLANGTHEGKPDAAATNSTVAIVERVEGQLIGYLENSAPPDAAKWFDFDNVSFKPGSASLSEDSIQQLELMADILKAFPQAGLTIGGYTDNVGEQTANRNLSEARAKAVVSSLVKRGVPATRLKASGFGDQRPIADNSTPGGRAKNRRIAVSVTAK